MILIWILIAYTFVSIFIALSEKIFLQNEAKKEAVILSKDLYDSSIKIAVANKNFEIFQSLYMLGVNACWLGFGLKILREKIVPLNTLFQNTLFLLSFLLIFILLNLPLGYFKDMIMDKKNGFKDMSLKLFLIDTIKSLLLTAIIGFILLYALLFCLQFLGEFWWLAAFGVSFLFIIAANVFYPTLIMPLFNKMLPLEDEGLLGKIKGLMDKSGFKASGVYVMDASKRDKRLNAFLGGLFKTKRVVLFDTLIKGMKENELIAVLAHELGHFKHKDLLKGVFNSAIMLFILFFIMAHIPQGFYEKMGLGGVDSAVFVAFIMFGNILSLIFFPFINHLSRVNEYAADAYAASQVGAKDMKEALLVLAKENKAFIKHSKIETFFNHTHPSIYDRLKALDKC